MMIDYLSLWNEQSAAASRQKEFFTGGRSFWEDPKNARHFLHRLFTSDRFRIENQLAALRISPGSTVLDVGAGPGTLAVPLALAGCLVTTVEPSAAMREMMQEYRAMSGAPEIRQIPSRWEDADPEEIGTHDVVVASLSLALDDIGPSLLKMDAAAKKSVHLFWFLSPSSGDSVNEILWPKLHGTAFAGEPRADLLWNCLCQLGIYPHLSVGKVKKERRFLREEEVVDHYCRSLYVCEEWQREIVAAFVRDAVVRDDEGLYVPVRSRTAHIWWEKDC